MVVLLYIERNHVTLGPELVIQLHGSLVCCAKEIHLFGGIVHWLTDVLVLPNKGISCQISAYSPMASGRSGAKIFFGALPPTGG